MSVLTDLIEPDIVEQINNLSDVTIDKNYHIELSHNRFDLAFKLYFLKGLSFSKHSSFRDECYKLHIKAFSEGTFSEPHNSEKSSYEAFKGIFEDLYSSLKTEGFDAERSLIPLANDGSILNGAHRTATTIFFNKPAGVARTSLPPRNFNYTFFQERGVPIKMLDIAAQTFIEYDEKCFLAVVWPAAKGFDGEIDSILSKVVYKKSVKLNYNGAHNLLSEAYKDEPWLGEKSKNFPGIKNKLVGCFPDFDPVRIYVFKAESLKDVLILKDKVRDLFKIEKHAIHITDTQEEAVRLSRLLLNDNGVHFLNFAYPCKYSNINFSALSQKLSSESLGENDVIFNENVLLELYGLRKNESSNEESLCYKEKSEKAILSEFYTDNQIEFLDNPKNYFWYKGFKFIGLRQVYLMKQKRRTPLDLKDLKSIKKIMTANHLQEKVDLIRSAFYFKKLRFIANTRIAISSMLNKLGLLSVIKKLLGR